MIQVIVGNRDITQYVVKAEWAGSLGQVARTLAVDLIEVIPELGDAVTLALDGAVLFEGYAMYVDRSETGRSLEAMDRGVYLANNAVYKEYYGTPQAIARQVCAEFGVAVGRLAERPDAVKVTSTGSLSAYQAMEQAYEGEDYQERRYVLRMAGGALCVERAGADVVAAVREEIASGRQTYSLKRMVNQVVILDAEGKKAAGTVENAADRRQYGTFQAAYQSQKDKNASVEAQKKLRGVEQTARIAAQGLPACVAGKAVQLAHPPAGLDGVYTIAADTHVWTASGHTMTLDLYFGEG